MYLLFKPFYLLTRYKYINNPINLLFGIIYFINPAKKCERVNDPFNF